MKKVLTFLVLAVIMGLAAGQGSWYPQKVGGKPIQSDGGGTNYAFAIALQTIPVAETSDDDQLFAATTGHCNQTTNINKSTFLAQPDVPRNIIATFNASTSGSIKITGTDISGAAITENLTISSATTGASTKAFKTVTRINADLTTGQTNKTLKMGTGDLLGLNSKLATNTVLLVALNDTKEATAPAVTVNSTVLSLNTIDTNTAPGGKVTKVWYIV